MRQVKAPHIRAATPADLPALADLLALLFALEPDFPIDRPRQLAGLALLLRHPERAAIFVAERDGAVVGMVSVQTSLSTAEGGEAALLEDLVVHPDGRGGGFGRALLEAVEGWCRGRGIRRLQLLADRENDPALGFYRHAGWESTRLIGLRRVID
jgi:GNAT superfamily N-acetyltransferase